MSILKTGSSIKIIKCGSLEEVAKGKVQGTVVEEKNPDFLYFRAIFLHADMGDLTAANGNGDVFPKDEVLKSYATFIGKHVDLNHDFQNMKNIVGKIIDAYPIEDAKSNECYIEGLCKIDRKANPEIARQIETGLLDSVSMEASVESSECSICGHVIHTEMDEKCEHFAKGLNKEYDVVVEGKQEKRKCLAINRGITFSGLGIVTIPADGDAKILSIISELQEKLTKTSALDVEGKKKIVEELNKIMATLDPETKTKVKAQVCGCEVKTETNDVSKILEKLNALEYIKLFEHIEDKVAGKEKKAEVKVEEVKKEVVRAEAKETPKPEEKKSDGLELNFGLKGERVKIIKGPYKDQQGTILEETGYTDGVVCKIRLDSGEIVEYSIRYWKEIENKECIADKKADKIVPVMKAVFIKKAELKDCYWIILKDHKPILKAVLGNAWNSDELVKYEKYITSKVYADNLIKRIEKEGIEKTASLVGIKKEAEEDFGFAATIYIRIDASGKDKDDAEMKVKQTLWNNVPGVLEGLGNITVSDIEIDSIPEITEANKKPEVKKGGKAMDAVVKPVNKFAELIKAKVLEKKLAFVKESLKIDDKGFEKLKVFANRCPNCFRKLFERTKEAKKKDKPWDAKKFDSCVKGVMEKPGFAPEDPKMSKKEAAEAICAAQMWKEVGKGPFKTSSEKKVSDLTKEESAFDIQETIIIGDGYVASKNKETKEIIVKDKEGKEVGKYIDAFGEDMVSIMKFFRQLLKLDKEKPEPGKEPLDKSLGPTTQEVKEEVAPPVQQPSKEKAEVPASAPVLQASVEKKSEEIKDEKVALKEEVEVKEEKPKEEKKEDKEPVKKEEPKDIKKEKEAPKEGPKEEPKSVEKEVKQVEKEVKSIEKDIKNVKKDVKEIKEEVGIVDVKDKGEIKPEIKEKPGIKPEIKIEPMKEKEIIPEVKPEVIPVLKSEAELALEEKLKVEQEKAAKEKADLEAKLKSEQEKVAKEKAEAEAKAKEERTLKALKVKSEKIESIIKEMISRDMILISDEHIDRFQKEGKTLLDAREMAGKIAVDKQRADLFKMDDNALEAFESSIKRIKKLSSKTEKNFQLHNAYYDPISREENWMDRLPWS